MKSSFPIVLLVGRTNVGKSTLFNRLSESVKSLTYDQPGVTRDFMSDIVTWNSVSFNLIDTGGLLERSQTHDDPLSQHVQQSVMNLLKKADLVVFVVDGIVGLTEQDRLINKMLQKNDVPVMVAVNKIDNSKSEEFSHEFYQLGRPELFMISAQHSKGIGELLDSIKEHIKKSTPKTLSEPLYKIALIGKPNVGKSSLMNILLKQERSLVSDIAGTTREALSESIEFYKETLQLTDTPGIRRKRGITDKLEHMMVHSALYAIQRTTIVLLLIDGSSGQLSDQELKLAFYALKEYKGLILLINKYDITNEHQEYLLKEEFKFNNHLLKKIPHLFISCKTEFNIGKIMPLCQRVWERYSQEFDPTELNDLLKTAFTDKPHYYNNKMLTLYKAEQVKTAPITIVLKVNESEWFSDSHCAFFENVMRKHYELDGVPVRFLLRKRYKS